MKFCQRMCDVDDCLKGGATVVMYATGFNDVFFLCLMPDEGEVLEQILKIKERHNVRNYTQASALSAKLESKYKPAPPEFCYSDFSLCYSSGEWLVPRGDLSESAEACFDASDCYPLDENSSCDDFHSGSSFQHPGGIVDCW